VSVLNFDFVNNEHGSAAAKPSPDEGGGGTRGVAGSQQKHKFSMLQGHQV
jgi:hypothetical protein